MLVIWLNTNQYATGLALSLFGAGFSAFAGIKYVQEKLPERPQFHIPLLGDIPVLGPALFRQHPMVYVAMLLVAGLIWFLYRSRAGLVLRAVGESPESAHALGRQLADGEQQGEADDHVAAVVAETRAVVIARRVHVHQAQGGQPGRARLGGERGGAGRVLVAVGKGAD